jgi:hypothetical protein
LSSMVVAAVVIMKYKLTRSSSGRFCTITSVNQSMYVATDL